MGRGVKRESEMGVVGKRQRVNEESSIVSLSTMFTLNFE